MSEKFCVKCGDTRIRWSGVDTEQGLACHECARKALAFDTPANRATVKAFDESRTEALREDAFDAKREQAREDVAAELDGDRLRLERMNGERDGNWNRVKDGGI